MDKPDVASDNELALELKALTRPFSLDLHRLICLACRVFRFVGQRQESTE